MDLNGSEWICQKGSDRRFWQIHSDPFRSIQNQIGGKRWPFTLLWGKSNRWLSPCLNHVCIMFPMQSQHFQSTFAQLGKCFWRHNNKRTRNDLFIQLIQRFCFILVEPSSAPSLSNLVPTGPLIHWCWWDEKLEIQSREEVATPMARRRGGGTRRLTQASILDERRVLAIEIREATLPTTFETWRKWWWKARAGRLLMRPVSRTTDASSLRQSTRCVAIRIGLTATQNISSNRTWMIIWTKCWSWTLSQLQARV